MSTPPPPFDPADDADERYRRASKLDPSRPSEATRRVVLEHAARLAAERTRNARRRWLPLAGVTLRWQAIVGTAAAAALAGVMIAPRFLAPTVPSDSQSAPVGAPAAQETRPVPAPPPASSPAPVEPVAPVSRAVNAPERARIPPTRAQLRESAPAELAPGARPAAPAASDAMTTLQLEQRAEASTARARSQEEVVVTGARRAEAPTAAVSPAAAVRPPPAALLSGSAASDSLRHAAAAGDLTALKGALAAGLDVDARDGEGRTALMLATLNGQAGAVAALLARGADPSGADAHGTTPLQAAVAADEREIIAMLRSYGAR